MKFEKIVLGLAVGLGLLLAGWGFYLTLQIFEYADTLPLTRTAAADAAGGAQANPVEELLALKKRTSDETLNILVVGLDSGQFKDKSYFDPARSGPGRTDTIMLLSINRRLNRLSLLSVPRDTYLEIPGRGMDKVNHAHAFGGIGLSIQSLSQFLGIPIHHYVKINYDAFVKAVDDLGGIDIDVAQDVIDFEDGKIKVSKGLQHMDGATAFDFVQVRQGDIERVQRQQQFVKGLARQATNLDNAGKLPGTLADVLPQIQTDMNAKEILQLVLEYGSMRRPEILSRIVPGTAQMINGISYWVSDPAGTKEVVEEVFYPEGTKQIR